MKFGFPRQAPLGLQSHVLTRGNALAFVAVVGGCAFVVAMLISIVLVGFAWLPVLFALFAVYAYAMLLGLHLGPYILFMLARWSPKLTLWARSWKDWLDEEMS